MRSRSIGKTAVASAALVTCLLVAAVRADDAKTAVSTPDSQADWAKVVHVQPLHRTVRVVRPHQECWDAPVKRYRTRYRNHRYGSGQPATTIAVLGGSAARDVQHHNRYHQAARESYTIYEQRCKTVQNYQEERRPDGFLVDYEYHGRLYTTRTSHHPGDKIRVRVPVQPTN